MFKIIASVFAVFLLTVDSPPCANGPHEENSSRHDAEGSSGCNKIMVYPKEMDKKAVAESYLGRRKKKSINMMSILASLVDVFPPMTPARFIVAISKK